MHYMPESVQLGLMYFETLHRKCKELRSAKMNPVILVVLAWLNLPYFCLISKAVQKQLTEHYDTKILRHRQLADYYQYHCNDLTAVTNQLAHQLTLAKEGQRLVDFFRTDIRSTRVNAIERSRLLKVNYFQFGNVRLQPKFDWIVPSIDDVNFQNIRWNKITNCANWQISRNIFVFFKVHFMNKILWNVYKKAF